MIPTQTSTEPVAVKTRISHLDLSDCIDVGERVTCGGYSDIYHGVLRVHSMKIKVAVKELRLLTLRESTIPSEERLEKRFFREVLLWQTLQHSNVVPLSGFMIRDKIPSLISPWYKNGNITQYLKSHPNPNRPQLCVDVAKGLAYLHSIPVAHGDLKGENALVDANGRASLCDFGMSHFMDEASRITGFTTSTAGGTTGRFASPEILEDKPKNSATDIWAFGCLVVQTLTDQIPYKSVVGKLALPLAIISGQPPMTNADDKIDGKVWVTLARCWSKLPQDRPSASDLELCLEVYRISVLNAALKGFLPSVTVSVPRSVLGLEFSPDGKFLAAIFSGELSDDNHLVIWKVEHGALSSPETRPCTAALIVWNPSATLLICMCQNHIEIWSAENLKPIATYPVGVEHNNPIKISSWLKNSEAIVYVEDCEIIFQHLSHDIETSRISAPISVRSIAFSLDGQRMIVVGSSDRVDLQFALCCYNESENGVMQLDCTALLWHEPISVDIARAGADILVGYNQSPPQLWHMETARKEVNLIHTYKTNNHANLLWESVKFGDGDMLVIGLTDAGDIHFWDRESANYLHCIANRTPDVKTTHISWNHGEIVTPIFAAANSDHTLTIWSAQKPINPQPGVNSNSGAGEQMMT